MSSVLHDWTALDPACDVNDPLEPGLLRVAQALLQPLPEPLDGDWLPGARTAAASAFSLNRN